MAEPKRRENRRTHLDASVVPVERALLARAGELEQPVDTAERIDMIKFTVAAEFRALAEELHWH
jgi:hypothetical protein